MLVGSRAHRGLRLLFGRSNLDLVIPPEIHGDGFASLATAIASRPGVRTALDIGASTGAGSSAALFDGLKAKDAPLLVCLELSATRFEHLAERFADHEWIHCLNDSSVPVEEFASEDEVRRFLRLYGGRAVYGRSTLHVRWWLRRDRREVVARKAAGRGIERALRLIDAEAFDLVLIDGSEFTAAAELDRVVGARFILLDDVRTYKNHGNRQRLLDDPDYELIAEDLQCRNGYSAFERR